MQAVGGNLSALRLLLRKRGNQVLTILVIVLVIDHVLGFLGHRIITRELARWLRVAAYGGLGLFMLDYAGFALNMRRVQPQYTFAEAWTYFMSGFTWKFLRNIEPQKVRAESRRLVRNQTVLAKAPWLKERIESEFERGHVACLAVLNEFNRPASSFSPRKQAATVRRAAELEKRQRRSDERIERRVQRLEAKHMEKARKAVCEAEERQAAMLRRAERIGCVEIVERYIADGKESDARQYLDRADQLFDRASRVGIAERVRRPIADGDPDAADALVTNARRDLQKQAIIAKLLERTARLRDGRVREVTAEIGELSRLPLHSREWKKAKYEIEKQLP